LKIKINKYVNAIHIEWNLRVITICLSECETRVSQKWYLYSYPMCLSSMAITSLIETSRKSTYFSDFALTVIKAWIPYKRSVTKDPKGRHLSNEALLLLYEWVLRKSYNRLALYWYWLIIKILLIFETTKIEKLLVIKHIKNTIN
jgi:hypothetical protein